MSLKIIHFKIDDENFGIDIGEVQEIVPYLKGVVVSGSHPELDSLVKIRGRVIPVLNLRRKFGVLQQDSMKDNRIIILRTEVGLIGLSVDSVKNVITLEDRDISGVPKLLPKLSVKYVDSIGQIDGELVLLLRTETLFSDFDMEMVSSHSGMSEEDFDKLESKLSMDNGTSVINIDDENDSKKAEAGIELKEDELDQVINIEEAENNPDEDKPAIWPCPMCGKIYKTEAWVTRHIKSEHADFLGE